MEKEMKALRKKISDWRNYKRTVVELTNLDDRVLADLGIRRDEIPVFAKNSIL